MEDDVPVVTEWTENGLPQRRSRGRARSARTTSRSSPAAPVHANGAQPGRDQGAGDQGGGEKPPGLWLEAFTKAVNGVPQERKHGEDSDDAWDKGDLK